MEKPSEGVGAEDAAGELSGRRFLLVSRRCYLTVKYVGGRTSTRAKDQSRAGAAHPPPPAPASGSRCCSHSS